MLRLLVFLMMLLIPASAAAEESAPPKYPLGFDCSAAPAGPSRHACYQSRLDPPMGPIAVPKRAKPGFHVPPAKRQPLSTTPPPTIPRLPGTIPRSY